MKFILQKGSPFLEGLNGFNDNAFEAGLTSDKQGYTKFPNSTKCLTWEGVKASHMKEDHEVAVTFEDTYGIIILLASGLGGALVILTLEYLNNIKKKTLSKDNTTSLW